jgi:DNA-binding transcriptional ArsR family regulator
MKDGPDISITAALIGDPARANMVMALMSGSSLTMGELAAEAGVTLSTASVHLAKLESSRIVVSRKQGRSRHFRIADPDVAHCIEALVTVAARDYIAQRYPPAVIPLRTPDPRAPSCRRTYQPRKRGHAAAAGIAGPPRRRCLTPFPCLNRHSCTLGTGAGAIAHGGHFTQSRNQSSSPDDAYKALTTLEGLSGWWTNDTQGESKVGGVIQFRFGAGRDPERTRHLWIWGGA